MDEILPYVKKHYLLIGGGVVAAIALYLIVSRSGGSGAAQQSGIDPTSAALYNAQLQSQTQLQSQSNQIAGQVTVAQLQAQTTQQQNTLGAQVDLAKIASDQTLGEASAAVQLQAANNSLTAQSEAIGAQLAGLESNNQTTQYIAQVNANENTAIANLTAQTQQAISYNQTQVAETQANDVTAQVYAVQKTIRQQSSNSLLGSLGSIVGGLL